MASYTGFELFVKEEHDFVNRPIGNYTCYVCFHIQIKAAAKESDDAAELGEVGVSGWVSHSASQWA